MTYKKTTYCLSAVFFIFAFLLPALSFAKTEIKMTFQVPIPGFSDQTITIDSNSIGNYIKNIYTYLIGSVGIIATVILMYAGFLWITAMGNPGQITEAKAWITSAMTGMVIALASYVILYWVNPDLLNFKPIAPTDITPTQSQSQCEGSSVNYVNSDLNLAKTNCDNSCGTDKINVSKSNFLSNGTTFCCVCNKPTGCCITTKTDKTTGKQTLDCEEGAGFDYCIDKTSKLGQTFNFYDSSCHDNAIPFKCP